MMIHPSIAELQSCYIWLGLRAVPPSRSFIQYMNSQHADLQQTIKSLQAENKSLLQKNQDDLIRIRQQEAQLKKAMQSIESERTLWAAKQQQYLEQIRQLRKDIDSLKSIITASQNENFQKLKSVEQGHAKKSDEIKNKFEKQLTVLKTQICRAQQEIKLQRQQITVLKEKIRQLEETSSSSKNTAEILSRAYNLLQTESNDRINRLEASLGDLEKRLHLSQKELEVKSQTNIQGEERLEKLQKQIALNKQLIKSLQTLLKVKEFQIERLSGD